VQSGEIIFLISFNCSRDMGGDELIFLHMELR